VFVQANVNVNFEMGVAVPISCKREEIVNVTVHLLPRDLVCWKSPELAKQWLKIPRS